MSNTTPSNLMDKLNKLIKIIRELKEDAVAAVPTNSANTSGLGYNPNTETPPVFTRKKKNAYLGIGSRKRWMQKRTPPQ